MTLYSIFKSNYSEYQQLWRGENSEKFKQTCTKNRRKRKAKKKQL